MTTRDRGIKVCVESDLYIFPHWLGIIAAEAGRVAQNDHNNTDSYPMRKQGHPITMR